MNSPTGSLSIVARDASISKLRGDGSNSALVSNNGFSTRGKPGAANEAGENCVKVRIRDVFWQAAMSQLSERPLSNSGFVLPQTATSIELSS